MELIVANALAKTDLAEVAQRVAALVARGQRPGLAVILVGDNPASAVYVRQQGQGRLRGVGLHSVLDRHPATLSEAELLRASALKRPGDRRHPGAVPLPEISSTNKVIAETISPLKDVDGFHVARRRADVAEPGFQACTPYGCMKMLEGTIG